MNFQRKKVSAALAYMVGVGAAMAVSGAYAQAVNPDVPTNTRPEFNPEIKVEVTGSNIKRVEGEGALPVQVITREEIDKSGATNVEELLQTISANNSAGQVVNTPIHWRDDALAAGRVAARPRARRERSC